MLDPKVVIALDFNNTQESLKFASKVSPNLCRLKIGKELFSIGGPELVKELISQKFDVFLDLKYHDIPNTVAKACQSAANMGVWMLNIHALGGLKMMRAAKEAVESCQHQPILVAVTILTSMEPEDLELIGLSNSPKENVLRLAKLAKQAGLDGVVCSAQESAMLRSEIGKDFCLITPGIRPEGADINDQKRIMTPVEAINYGSNYLVIGRPITQAKDPISVLKSINKSIAATPI